MMTTLTITLPHTPRCLSPNAKAPLTQRGAIVAGYKKTAAKSRARNIAWGRTCEALNGRRMLPTHYRVVWFYKGNKPDADNCLARCKAYLDGACKALGIDDRTLDCAGIDRVHDLDRAGKVEIVFEDRRKGWDALTPHSPKLSFGRCEDCVNDKCSLRGPDQGCTACMKGCRQ